MLAPYHSDKRVNMRILAQIKGPCKEEEMMWESDNKWENLPYEVAVIYQHILNKVNEVGLLLGQRASKAIIELEDQPANKKNFEEAIKSLDTLVKSMDG